MAEMLSWHHLDWRRVGQRLGIGSAVSGSYGLSLLFEMMEVDLVYVCVLETPPSPFGSQ